VDAIDLLGAQFDERLAIPRAVAVAVAQDPNGLRRDEAGAQQPRAQQPRAQPVDPPFAVLDVRLAPGARFAVLRIDQDERAPLLQYIEYGTPQHARTLHRHLRHRMETQPVAER
jgi:hypothetical protein